MLLERISLYLSEVDWVTGVEGAIELSGSGDLWILGDSNPSVFEVVSTFSTGSGEFFFFWQMRFL